MSPRPRFQRHLACLKRQVNREHERLHDDMYANRVHRLIVTLPKKRDGQYAWGGRGRVVRAALCLNAIRLAAP
jgi:hypothetical protein